MRALLPALLLIAGCLSFGDPDPRFFLGREPCDPLAADPQPIALAEQRLVGRAPDGTLYVGELSWEGHISRVFVSEGNTLVRRGVLALRANNGSTGRDDAVSFVNPRPVWLVAQTRGTIIKLALTYDGTSTLYDELVDKTELEPFPASSVVDMPLRNFPGEQSLEFVGSARGMQLVVTRLHDEPNAYKLRVYYGKHSLREHYAESATREPNVQIDFADDGGDEFWFADLVPGAPTLVMLDHRAHPLTARDVALGIPEGLRFSCLH